MRKRIRSHALAAVAVSLLLAPLPAAWAAATTATEESMQAMRGELEALRNQYEQRIRALEDRVRELEGERTEEPPETADEVDSLRAAAMATTGASDEPIPERAQTTAGKAGSLGSLSRLNPEISFTGDVVAIGGSGREDFDDREFELDLQSALDPYSRTRWTIAFSPEEGVEIEEGWILYSGLPGGLELKAGKFRQRFGPLNQQHLHALPQSDYPLALATYFDDEGLAQTGVALSWLLPKPWADANEFVLELTDGENPAFGGENFDRLVLLARLKNYWDLNASTYLEWGLSGVSGRAAGNLESEVLGTDLTLHWQPPARAKYRELTWRTELLRSKRDDFLGVSRKATGGYSYVEGLLRRNLYAGLRYDRVEDPLEPTLVTTGWTPYVSWWQSEYVRLRALYALLEDPSGATDDRFTLQITWAAGPHKHEAY